MNRTITYLIFKLNISTNIFSGTESVADIKRNKIPNAILAFQNIDVDPFIRDRGSKYTLANIEQLDENIIVGDVFRERDSKTSLYDEGRTKTCHQPEGDTFPFIYTIEEEFLFIKKNNSPKSQTLAEKFGEIISSYDTSIGDLKVDSKDCIDSVQTIIQNNKITKYEFTYIAPNDDPTFDDFGEFISEFNGTNGKIDFENKNGLSLINQKGEERPFVKQSLKYSKKGYGSTKITYIDDRQHSKTIHTNDSIMTEVLPTDKTKLEEIIQTVINKLKEE